MTAFDTARKNNVVIIVEPLANVYAYYNKVEGQKFIHVNDVSPDYAVKYLIAHMLYFALHEEDEFHMLSKEFTGSEKEAAKFALNLLRVKENLSEEDGIKLLNRLKRFWGKDEIENVLAHLHTS